MSSSTRSKPVSESSPASGAADDGAPRSAATAASRSGRRARAVAPARGRLGGVRNASCGVLLVWKLGTVARVGRLRADRARAVPRVQLVRSCMLPGRHDRGRRATAGLAAARRATAASHSSSSRRDVTARVLPAPLGAVEPRAAPVLVVEVGPRALAVPARLVRDRGRSAPRRARARRSAARRLSGASRRSTTSTCAVCGIRSIGHACSAR